MALADVNGLTLASADLIDLDYRLEHTYLGLDNGRADQSVILLGRDDALTQFDMMRREQRPILGYGPCRRVGLADRLLRRPARADHRQHIQQPRGRVPGSGAPSGTGGRDAGRGAAHCVCGSGGRFA